VFGSLSREIQSRDKTVRCFSVLLVFNNFSSAGHIIWLDINVVEKRVAGVLSPLLYCKVLFLLLLAATAIDDRPLSLNFHIDLSNTKSVVPTTTPCHLEHQDKQKRIS